MSSILTNTSAMVALKTLNGINKDLATTQSMISTGKKVDSARDNAAIWSISKVMESDVKGFKAISESLGLGQSTIAVAREAAETVTDLLTDIKGKITAAQEENVDRQKIQADIDELTNQIDSVVAAAQFNGLNLLENRDTTLGSGSISVLSSLDRASNGSVSTANISVDKNDLQTNAQVVAGSASTISAVAYNIVTISTTTTSSGSFSVTVTAAVGATAQFTVTADLTAGIAAALATRSDTGLNGNIAGLGFEFDVTGAGLFSSIGFGAGGGGAVGDVAYVAREGDTAADVASQLASAFASFAARNSIDTSQFNVTANGATLTIEGAITPTATTATTGSITFLLNEVDGTGTSANTIGGGLKELSSIDVTGSDADRAGALADVEGLIQNAIDAAASFGSAQGRIDTQADFMQQLQDAFKSGIGTLVDANMEEASAKLQALQVQQQLGIQALSIANQQPQNILALFQ